MPNVMNYFSSIDFDKNVVSIDWDIITLCQYKCPYCYVDRKNNWGKILNKNQIDKIISKFNVNKKLKVNLLGGEPTLHPKLEYIITELYKNKNVVDVGITTNLCRDLSFLNKYNIFYNLSFHPTETNIDDFIDNFKKIKSSRCKVGIILLKNKEHLYNELIEKIISVNDKAIIEPSYLWVNDKPKVYDSTCCNIERKDYTDGKNNYSYSEIINNKLNKFKGYKCYNNYYIIDIIGNIYENCLYSNRNIYKDDLISAEYNICQCEECIGNSFLEQLKINGNN